MLLQCLLEPVEPQTRLSVFSPDDALGDLNRQAEQLDDRDGALRSWHGAQGRLES